jgi:hypothetical protein
LASGIVTSGKLLKRTESLFRWYGRAKNLVLLAPSSLPHARSRGNWRRKADTAKEFRPLFKGIIDVRPKEDVSGP